MILSKRIIALLSALLFLLCSYSAVANVVKDETSTDETQQTDMEGSSDDEGVEASTSQPVVDCFLPPETGMCRAFIPSFFYNSTSKQCEDFVYGGCLGNTNRFQEKEKCLETCKSQDSSTAVPVVVEKGLAGDDDHVQGPTRSTGLEQNKSSGSSSAGSGVSSSFSFVTFFVSLAATLLSMC